MPNDYRLWNDPAVVAQFEPLTVPYHAQQVEVFLRLLPLERDHPIRILDLGCGGGTLLGTMLQVFPHGTGVGADFSEPMLAQARERLAPFGDRVQLVRVDFNQDGWERSLPGPFDAIVSRYAIHHVPDDRKQAVYRACFGLLRTSGVFINVEHVASASAYMEALWDRLMVDTLHAAALGRGEVASYSEVEARYHQRPDKAANILAPVQVQTGWLREVGFADVDCYWKCFELAIFGGYKR